MTRHATRFPGRSAVKTEIASKALFRRAARDQRCCAVCNSNKAWSAHHVVYEQHLTPRGLPRYSTLNALRLCHDCHEAHHKRRKTVPTQRLTDLNIAYAFHALGLAAVDYFARYYDTREPDARITLAFEAEVARG